MHYSDGDVEQHQVNISEHHCETRKISRSKLGSDDIYYHNVFQDPMKLVLQRLGKGPGDSLFTITARRLRPNPACNLLGSSGYATFLP